MGSMKYKGNAPRLVLEQGLSRGPEDEPARMCCPICGENAVHISFVRVEQGHTVACCRNDQTFVAATDRHLRNRGSEVVIGFRCEAEHWFDYVFDFHKGSTQLRMDSGRYDIDPETGVNMDPHAELWRD